MRKSTFAMLVTLASLCPAFAETGDATRGRQDFRACAPCHSLEPDRNMTGPSLANLWGRRAGSLSSFDRYSDALKSSGIIWDDRALDGWLTDPQGMVPDNDMPLEGIKDARVRADLVAFLKEATKPGAVQQTAQQGGMNGMGGMMGGGAHDPNLKNLEPGKRSRRSPIAATPIALQPPMERYAPFGSATCASGPTPARTGRTGTRPRSRRPA